MITKIDVFDFDGTLFRSPVNTKENIKLYEKAKDMPGIIDKNKSRELTKKHGTYIGMRRGWFGRPETLEPPLVPNPAPNKMFIRDVCNRFKKSKAENQTVTLMMTGRYIGLKDHVLRILGDGDLVKVKRKFSNKKLCVDCKDPDVTCLFNGQSGPNPKIGKKPGETLPWKLWILDQYLDVFKDVETVEIWEDREPHVKTFQSLADEYPQEIVVNHITD